MYEELKKLAEGATKSKWTTDGDWDVMSAESDQLNGGYVIAQFQGPDRKINALFCAAANPSAVLALIAENQRLERNRDMFKSQVGRQADALSDLRMLFADAAEQCCKAERERDQLKAENARSTEREILQLAEIEALRNEVRALQSNIGGSATHPSKGHGHVLPRDDGVRMRCGGPAMCKVCQGELAIKEAKP